MFPGRLGVHKVHRWARQAVCVARIGILASIPSPSIQLVQEFSELPENPCTRWQATYTYEFTLASFQRASAAAAPTRESSLSVDPSLRKFGGHTPAIRSVEIPAHGPSRGARFIVPASGLTLKAGLDPGAKPHVKGAKTLA